MLTFDMARRTIAELEDFHQNCLEPRFTATLYGSRQSGRVPAPASLVKSLRRGLRER
jgi:hypothetical protein